ncbi:MAG TPA: hypothetical protein VJS63_06295 [Bradyrhizobium sp.]|nr:hypothetical protein [Bradyrhizobium sp.]
MPVWMEILLNIIGYGGFVAIAVFHRSRSDASDRDLGGKPRVN